MKKPSYILMAMLVSVLACTPESENDESQITSETFEQFEEVNDQSIKKGEIKDSDVLDRLYWFLDFFGRIQLVYP